MWSACSARRLLARLVCQLIRGMGTRRQVTSDLMRGCHCRARDYTYFAILRFLRGIKTNWYAAAYIENGRTVDPSTMYGLRFCDSMMGTDIRWPSRENLIISSGLLPGWLSPIILWQGQTHLKRMLTPPPNSALTTIPTLLTADTLPSASIKTLIPVSVPTAAPSFHVSPIHRIA